MAAEIYVKEVEKSPLNAREADSTLQEGDFVTLVGGGDVDSPDVTGTDTVDGIIPHRERGPHIREHEEDYSDVQYESGEGPVPFYQLEDGMELTAQAATAGASVSMFDEVAFDSNLDVVPANDAAAETDAFGRALRDAADGEGVHVRVGL